MGQVCGRESCGSDRNVSWWNSSTLRWYCASCAHKINKFAPGLCKQQSMGMVVLTFVQWNSSWDGPKWCSNLTHTHAYRDCVDGFPMMVLPPLLPKWMVDNGVYNDRVTWA